MFDDQHDLLRKAADDHKEYEAEMERDRNWDVEPVCNGGTMSKEARQALKRLGNNAYGNKVKGMPGHSIGLDKGAILKALDRLDELENSPKPYWTLARHFRESGQDNTKLNERIAELERRGRHQSIVPRIKLYRELNPGATLKEAKERVESGWKPAATNSEQELTKSRQQVELLIGILSNLRTPADMAGMTFSNHPENEKAWHEWLDKQEDKT